MIWTFPVSNLVCELGVNGISIFVDATLSGFQDIRDTLRANRVPYFNFDYSIQSMVMKMESYLMARQASDAVLILPDETSVDEALHAFISKSPLRVILLNQLSPSNVQRLKDLRPSPNYFAIIAETVKTKELFQIVSLNPPAKIEARPLRAFSDDKSV